MELVIDTNILFSALLKKNSSEFQIIKSSQHEIYACQYSVIELFRHKEKLLRLSALDEESMLKAYYLMLQYIHPIEERQFPVEIREKAYTLCRDIDEYDTMFVASALFIDGLLWKGDKKQRRGLLAKGFDRIISTTDLIN